MNTTWQERSEGYFFPHENLPAAVKSKLEMLNLDDAAQISDDGTLIPFEKSVLLSQEDAELLNLPPHNPYQLSIRTEGVVTDKNFRYVVEFLNSDGRTIVNPKINGAILHIGSENIFRLNANQFALVNLVEFGNKNIATEEPLITVKKIQSQSVMAAAKVDDYISTKIIFVPDKLSVDFQEFGDRVKVQPVLLENRGDYLEPIDSASFQKTFGKHKKIPSVYKCGSGAQYVFSKILRDGLSQIKKVDTLSRADAARYKLQPKELFTGEAFDFSYSDHDADPYKPQPEESFTGEAFDFSYSDRVIGVEKILIGLYQNFGGVKINWSDVPFYSELPAPKATRQRSELFALKIKTNFERVDYEKNLAERVTEFFADVLRPGIQLLPHQKSGVGLMAQLWQNGWHGILLADDMGLGKTLQTLTFVASLKKSCAIKSPVLIVAPTALLTNWQEEYEKFLREKFFGDVIPLHGHNLRKFFTGKLTPNGNKKLSLENLPANSLAVTTYETLRDYQFSFAEIPWSCIIADEAQKIKNPDAGITKALKAMKYDFAICLSGTPVENSWIDKPQNASDTRGCW